MEDIKVAYDNLLVYQKGYTPEIVNNIIKEKGLKGLRIFAELKADRLDDIDFLADYDFLEQLDITSVTDFDFGFLHKLKYLKKLSINVEGNNPISFSGLDRLEYLSMQWRKGITGLEDTSLLSLGFIEFKEPNLSKVSALKNLADVRIMTATIETLEGLEGLNNLKSLTVSNCKRLRSISTINNLSKLERLEFNVCPKINTYNSLTNLPALQSLKLIDCGNVESVKFINNIPSLTDLSLLGNTVITDGDLLPAKRLKSLAHKHYKHYNIKIEDEAYNANIKSNLEKIKNLFK